MGRSLGPKDGPYPNGLREARVAAGLSQGDVARALGVSYIQVGRIERGYTKLSPAHCARLQPILTTNYDLLFSTEGERLLERITQLARRMTNKQKKQYAKLGDRLLVAGRSGGGGVVSFHGERR